MKERKKVSVRTRKGGVVVKESKEQDSASVDGGKGSSGKKKERAGGETVKGNDHGSS